MLLNDAIGRVRVAPKENKSMNATVLVVDDDGSIRELLTHMLEQGEHKILEAESAEALERAYTGPRPDVILLDLGLPDADGLDLIPRAKQEWPDTEIIVLTGNASIDKAVEATKRGAFYFQEKTQLSSYQSLLLLIDKALEHGAQRAETQSLRTALSTLSGGVAPIFQSPRMKEALRTVERIAPNDVSVLITGESGTGKEVIADLIHSMSHRNKSPFIKINCAALPRELIESELFGSVKGAYTGAQADRQGLFRQAEGGTLLLDELSEMPVDTQTKLLRVLQDKEVRPVGSRSTYKTDCRIIAATNRKVEEAIRDGKLREDLFYRISAITIELPPLRERVADIMPLATAFLKRFAAQANRSIKGFSAEAEELLRQYDWPGNVRQLQNEIQRAALMCNADQVSIKDLSVRPESASNGTEDNLSLMEAMERNTIVQMLKETNGNKLETAKRLGIGRQTLYNKIKAFGINPKLI